MISLIQAIARQRKIGEIHILLPKPDNFNFNSLRQANFSTLQIERFKFFYELVHYANANIPKVSYYPLDFQDYLTLDFYKDQLLYNVNEQISFIQSKERENLPSLIFPDYKNFKLNKGEDYLSNAIKFFGGDLSAYLTYCAFTNQFMNCKLEGFDYQVSLFFYRDRIQENLNSYYEQYFDVEYYSTRSCNSNFHLFYKEFRNELFSKFIIKYKNNDPEIWVTINPYNNKNFEIQLLLFIALKFYGTRLYSNFNEGFLPITGDYSYSRGMYFLDSIKSSRDINLQENSPIQQKNRVRLYQIIDYFRQKLIDNLNYSSSPRNEFCYLFNTPQEELFDVNDNILFNEMKTLIEHDSLLKNDIFEFRRDLTMSSFYRKLVEDFFETVSKKLSTGERQNVKKIITSKILPYSNMINLIELPEYTYEHPENDYIVQSYGSMENYVNQQEQINFLLEEYLSNN